MVKCWLSDVKIRLKDGSTLKVTPYNCPHSYVCLDYFSRVLTKGERMTKKGLLMDPNPVGPDLMLKFLAARCRHPQKHRISMHIASLPVVGVLIPTPLLAVIEEEAKVLEKKIVRKRKEA